MSIFLQNENETIFGHAKEKKETEQNFSFKKSSTWQNNSSSISSNEKKPKRKQQKKDVHEFKKVGKWTKDEDDILFELVPKYGGKNWKEISSFIKGRSAIQCLHRWTKILKPGLIKGPWTVEEDKRLIQWVKRNGPFRWSNCAEGIKGRSGKQCRERWFNSLNPEVIKGNWTIEEDFKIFILFKYLNGQWSKAQVFLEGRPENAIKNRFYSTLRKLANYISSEKRKLNKEDAFEHAFEIIKSKFMLEKEFSYIRLQDYETNFIEKIKKVYTKKVKFDIQHQKQPKNELQKNDDKKADVKNEINNICDNPSFVITDDQFANLGYQIDNIITSMFDKNNEKKCVRNDAMGTFAVEDNSFFNKVENNEAIKNDDIMSLFSQLNDLEKLVSNCKSEISKYNDKDHVHSLGNSSDGNENAN